MKRNNLLKTSAVITAAIILVLALVSCGAKLGGDDLWKNAKYVSDTEIGKGENTAMLEIKAGEKSITLTVHTDSDNLGEALIENDLISGEEGEFGLYVKEVNGIVADFDVDSSYWALYIDDEMAPTGVDGTEINEESVYRLEYTR